MAATQILSANSLTEQHWPTTHFKYTLQNMQVSRLMGVGANNAIVVQKDLQTKRGNKITMKMRAPLSNAGGYDDSDIEGHEEPMSFFNFPVEVHERNHGVKSAGIMTDQRSKVNIRREAAGGLIDWNAEQLEDDLYYALAGLGNQNTYAGEDTADQETVNEHAPSSNRHFRGGQTAAGVLEAVTTDALIDSTTANLFGTKVINRCRLMAVMAAPKIRPITVPGHGKFYLMLVHPFQLEAMRAETGEDGWARIVAQAQVRGNAHPMFSGAEGLWNGVVMWSYERVQLRVAGEVFDDGDAMHANAADGTYAVARALLLGAQAGCLAWAKMPARKEKNFDYGRKPGTAIDMIYGVSKTQFRDPGVDQAANDAQDDFALITCDTMCATPV